MKPSSCSVTALVFPWRSSVQRCAPRVRPETIAGTRVTPAQCMWVHEIADLSGQCTDYSVRSAANNGKSGFFTLYLYEEAGCAGRAVSKTTPEKP